MFERSRRKIVAAIMAILALLFLGTLSVIYVTSYIEVSNANFEMLEHHAEMYVLPNRGGETPFGEFLPGAMEPMPGSAPNRKPFENDPSFQLSTFYSVAVAADGTVLATDIGGREIYDAQTLETYASEILSGAKLRGTKGSLVYFVAQKNGYTLVAFMDNTVIHQSMTTLFRNTLIFGSVVLAALFFLAVHIARRIVRPLEESYQKQKQFISDAGHELKTPVSVVGANAELLGREIGENQWLANIRYENERMGTLVTQLLELARTEAIKPQTERLDFSRLVAGDVLPFECIAFEQGLTLNTQIEEGIFVEGCATQLSQLVSILVDNAIRHGRSGGEVRVCLAHSRSAAKLSVLNRGDPIPQEETARLFERFYRADEARNGEDRHYGLGLSIAKAIAETHGSEIEVSCHDGWVCFAVRLPKL